MFINEVPCFANFGFSFEFLRYRVSDSSLLVLLIFQRGVEAGLFTLMLFLTLCPQEISSMLRKHGVIFFRARGTVNRTPSQPSFRF